MAGGPAGPGPGGGSRRTPGRARLLPARRPAARRARRSGSAVRRWRRPRLGPARPVWRGRSAGGRPACARPRPAGACRPAGRRIPSAGPARSVRSPHCGQCPPRARRRRQRRGQFGAPPLPRSQRPGGGSPSFPALMARASASARSFSVFGQLGVARGPARRAAKARRRFSPARGGGPRFCPQAARRAGASACRRAASASAARRRSSSCARARAASGRGGGLLDGGVQRLQLRGQRRGQRFALFEQLRGQRGRGGCPVGVLCGLQGAQRGGGVRFALLRAGRGQLQPPQFQQHAGVGVLGGAGGRGGALARGVAQAAVRPGVKHLPQDGRAVGAGGVEQAGKVVLCDQRDLRELFGVDAQQRRDGGGHGLRAAEPGSSVRAQASRGAGPAWWRRPVCCGGGGARSCSGARSTVYTRPRVGKGQRNKRSRRARRQSRCAAWRAGGRRPVVSRTAQR